MDDNEFYSKVATIESEIDQEESFLFQHKEELKKYIDDESLPPFVRAALGTLARRILINASIISMLEAENE